MWASPCVIQYSPSFSRCTRRQKKKPLSRESPTRKKNASVIWPSCYPMRCPGGSLGIFVLLPSLQFLSHTPFVQLIKDSFGLLRYLFPFRRKVSLWYHTHTLFLVTKIRFYTVWSFKRKRLRLEPKSFLLTGASLYNERRDSGAIGIV